MRQLGVVMASALLALGLFVQGGVAQAGWQDIEWCYEDPTVIVFGAQFKVVAAAQTQASSIGGYAYEIEVPSNAVGRTIVSYPHGKFASTNVQVSYTGAAWNGSGPLTVSGTVTVAGPAGTAVAVSVAGPTVSSATFSGVTNAAISFTVNPTPGVANSSGSGQ